MLENVKILYEEEVLQQRIAELADQMDQDYQGKNVTIVCVLKGAVFFMVDLVKKMKTPVELEIMQISSYEGKESTGEIKIRKDLDHGIEGKDVLIVEDIIDTGYTLKHLREYLLSKHPNSLKIAVLADKKERREVQIPLDYTGFVIPNKFVIGYGFDYNEQGRNLPYIGYIEDSLYV